MSKEKQKTEAPRDLIIKEDLVVGIFNYLLTQPAKDVLVFIDELRKLNPIEDEEIDENPEGEDTPKLKKK